MIISQSKQPSSIMKYIFSIVVGLLYGGWPVLARKSDAHPFWISLMVSVMTVATILVLGNKNILMNAPKGRMLLFLVICGLMNGIATWYYGKLVGTPGWNVSTLVPISMTVLLFTSAIGGMLFLKEPVSSVKILGLVLAIPAMWLMSR